MSSVSSEKRRRIFQNSLSNLEECIELIGQYFPGEEREEQLQVIKELVKEYHEIETKYDLTQKARDLTEAHFNEEGIDESANVDDVWKRNMEKSISSIIPLQKHPDMTKIILALTNAGNRPSTSQNVRIKTEIEEPADS